MNSLNDLVVLLGSEEMPWSVLEAANTRIGSLFKQDWNFVHSSNVYVPQIVRQREKLRGLIDNSYHGFGDWMIRFSDTPIDGCLDMDGVTESSKRGIKFSKLLYVLDATSNFRCMDGRDKLFAILPLFQTPIPSLLRPDYSKTLDEVYTDLSWYLINHNVCNVVQFLRRPDHDESLPSWVVDWRHDYVRATTYTFSYEPEDPFGWQRLFKFHERQLYARREGRTLILRGTLVDRVDVCFSREHTVRWKNGSKHRVTAPHLTLPDDSIVFCSGFPFPFILRRKFDGDYHMIGTCHSGDETIGKYHWNDDWQEYAEITQRGPASDLTEFRIC